MNLAVPVAKGSGVHRLFETIPLGGAKSTVRGE